MMGFLAFFELSDLYRMLGIASELLLLPVFLWPTRPAPRRWPLLLAFLAAFELVTWFSVESTFFDMVGLVLIRLAIFALVLLCVYRLQPVRSMVLAMVYFLLTMPLRWMVTAAVLFLPYSPLAGFAPVVWLAEYLPLRSLLYFLLQLLCILLCQRKTPALAIETGNRVNWVMCPALIAFYLYLRYDLKYLGFNERTRLFDLLMVLTAFLGLVLITALAQYVFILQRQRM